MLDMRHSTLDIEDAPNRCASQATTVVRVQIEARNRLVRREHDRQLQLCVPLVITDGDSYRMKQARARGGATKNTR
jgi:hypothetical protein